MLQPPPAPPVPAVAIRGLTKFYDNVPAVQGLDLVVPAGTITALVGPNGAGKTTTMRALVTLLEPDAGDVAVFGVDPRDDARAVRRMVGWMPDFFGVYDGLSCAEYLSFFADAYYLPSALRSQQVADLLELVELSHVADRDVAGLSRGMQQRLSLARALVHDPRLLVLDEPASGLDPRARVELREILVQLGRMGHTILVSSHILAELEELCDRAAFVDGGRVVASGTPDQIRAQVAGALTVTIRILGGAAATTRARDLLAARGTAVTSEGSTLRVEVDGGEEQAADLLAALVGDGLRVTDYHQDRGGLERLFLSVTRAAAPGARPGPALPPVPVPLPPPPSPSERRTP